MAGFRRQSSQAESTLTDVSGYQSFSALNSEDPGMVNIGQIFTDGFPTQLANIAFGQDLASGEVRAKMTPNGN